MSLEDRLAILEMLGRYALADDAEDAEAYGAIFTEDGVFEVFEGAAPEPRARHLGRAAIRAWAQRRYDADEHRSRHHQTGTVFDELTPTSARTRTILASTVLRAGESTPVVRSTGVYTDEWAKTAAGWRLRQRSLRLDSAGAAVAVASREQGTGA